MPKYLLEKAWGSHAAGSVIDLTEDDAAPLVGAGRIKSHASAPSDPSDAIVARIVDGVAKGMEASAQAIVDKALAPLLDQTRRPRFDPVPGENPHDRQKSFGHFLSCAYQRDTDLITKMYYGGVQKAPLSEGSGALGAYLVPHEYLPGLMRLSTENGIVRPRARVLPMSSRTLSVPALRQTVVPGTRGSAFVGGVRMVWTEDTKAKTESNPVFRMVDLMAHELSGLAQASRNLMADSAIAIDSFLTDIFAEAIAWQEDDCFLFGDGVGKPKGALVSEAALSSARETSNTFKLKEAALMWAKLLPSSQNTAVWLMSQSVIPQLIQMQDGSGRVVFMPTSPATGSATQAVPLTLFGRPIIFSEKLPALGTAMDVCLVDFRQYLIGDRNQIEVAASSDFGFDKNVIYWRFLHRIDGQSWLEAPLTLADGTTKVSPFVYLAA